VRVCHACESCKRAWKFVIWLLVHVVPASSLAILFVLAVYASMSIEAGLLELREFSKEKKCVRGLIEESGVVGLVTWSSRTGTC